MREGPFQWEYSLKRTKCRLEDHDARLRAYDAEYERQTGYKNGP